MTAPGWYPDPSDPSRQRFFDGFAWTENYAPFGGPPQQLSAPKSGMSKGVKVGLGVGTGVATLLFLGAINNSEMSPTTSSNSNTNGGFFDAIAPSPKSGFTPSQDNAIAKAESYLNTSAWSKEGLIDQLVRGSKFSKADATFAVEQLEINGGVDWNEQAVKKAQSYLGTSSWSLQGLIDQLQRGSKFTPAQAQYGATTAYGG